MTGTPYFDAAKHGLTSLSELQGMWRLHRDINHADGSLDFMQGHCSFDQTSDGLIQDETGVLTTQTGTFEATRRYIWTETDSLLHVHFADGRPFVTIPLGMAQPRATHHCAPDRYDVVFDFRNRPAWRSVWTVKGPHKSYVMTSLFERS